MQDASSEESSLQLLPWTCLYVQQVTRYDLSNGGVTASFISYGATLTSLKAPDKNGQLEEMCLQQESLSDIQSQTAYYGKSNNFLCLLARVYMPFPYACTSLLQ
jgi:Aldose 1-epimerase